MKSQKYCCIKTIACICKLPINAECCLSEPSYKHIWKQEHSASHNKFIIAKLSAHRAYTVITFGGHKGVACPCGRVG